MAAVTVLGRVLEVWRYPVKSLRGERVERAELSEQGIPFDRAWGVVDSVTGKVLSAKREARLLEGAAHLDGDVAVLELPGGTRRADDPSVHAALSGWLGRDVRLERAGAAEQRSYEMNVSAEDEGSPTFDFPCPPGTFFDAAAL